MFRHVNRFLKLSTQKRDRHSADRADVRPHFLSLYPSRRLYNGLLPFGVMKGEDRVPVPDPTTFPGLKLMFELAASGKSDREVARALNAAGYRTAGNRVGKPFTKDGVRGILINRFFVGELPDGKGGWTEGSHQPFINAEQFQEVQDMRARNRKQP